MAARVLLCAVLLRVILILEDVSIGQCRNQTRIHNFGSSSCLLMAFVSMPHLVKMRSVNCSGSKLCWTLMPYTLHLNVYLTLAL